MIRFNRYYLSGAIGLTVCMLGAFLSLAVNVESRARMFRVIGESESREAAIREFMGLIVDAETAQRSYLLTSNPRLSPPVRSRPTGSRSSSGEDSCRIHRRKCAVSHRDGPPESASTEDAKCRPHE